MIQRLEKIYDDTINKKCTLTTDDKKIVSMMKIINIINNDKHIKMVEAILNLEPSQPATTN
jgi:hypothetical protein